MKILIIGANGYLGSAITGSQQMSQLITARAVQGVGAARHVQCVRRTARR